MVAGHVFIYDDGIGRNDHANYDIFTHASQKKSRSINCNSLLSLGCHLWELETETVRSFIVANGGEGNQGGTASVSNSFDFHFLRNFIFISTLRLILAAIGLIESLMTLNSN